MHNLTPTLAKRRLIILKASTTCFFDQYRKWMSSDKPSGSCFQSSNYSFATIIDEDQNEIEDSSLFDVSFSFL